MSVLLDSSVLIAAAFQAHVHNAAADLWLGSFGGSYATSPITQGALVRAALRNEISFADALELLALVTADTRHEFWADDIPFYRVPARGLVGHRQVTDAYLAQLARHRGGRVATLDRAMAAAHPDVAELITT